MKVLVAKHVFNSVVSCQISCAPFIQVLAVLEFERLDNGIA